MSKYFFHVINGKAVVDDQGVELADMDAMCSEAARSAGEMIASGDQTWNGEAWQTVVTDEDANIVYGLRFSIDRHGV
jgi:hypothetical protein